MLPGRCYALLCLFGSLLSMNRYTLAQRVVSDNCLQIFRANGTTTAYPFTSLGDPAPPPTIVINPTPMYGPCAPEWTITREVMTVIAMNCRQTQVRDEPLLTSMGGPVKITCVPSTTRPPPGLTPPVPTPPRRTEVLSFQAPRLMPPVPTRKETFSLTPPVPSPPVPPPHVPPPLPPPSLTNMTPRSKDPPGLIPPVPHLPPLSPTEIPGLTPPMPAPIPPPTNTMSPPKEPPRLTPPAPTLPAQIPPNKGQCIPSTVTVIPPPTDCPPPTTVTRTTIATMEIALATKTVTVALSTITFVSTRVVSVPASIVTATFTTVDCGACPTNGNPVIMTPSPPRQRPMRWL